MAEGSATVYIVDDDPGVRDSLALLLGLKGFPVQTFGGPADFLREYDGGAGCLLLDIRMPGMDGLELQRQLALRAIALPVIIITAHGDVAAARTALKAGAVDFLEKPLDDEVLVATVREAQRRDAATRSDLAQRAEVRERLGRLTQREREVMDRVVSGMHNREIAAQLGISARTVEVYKARLMEKMQVRRVADLVRLALGSDADEPKGS